MTTVQERQLEARTTVAESDMKRSDSELHLVENGSADQDGQARGAQTARTGAGEISRKVIQATEKRRSSDADYNEQRFVAKHGHLKYLDYYCPQYKLQGKSHLPGLHFDDLENAITQNKAKTPKKN
ncbi:hypothetical protein B0H14DRAFT_2633784 [Mycena olivaceomarginata]|nr:hypothetical protein B0H14DRAFT_2633784 [Mycena olivaceomarginata]